MSVNMRRACAGGLIVTVVMFFILLQSLTVTQAVLTVLLPALVGVAIVLLILRSVERSRSHNG